MGGGHRFTPPTPRRYLEITPIPLTDPPEFKYQWEPRAAKETSKKDVLRFVAKVRPFWGGNPGFWGGNPRFWGAPGLHLTHTPPIFLSAPPQIQGKDPTFWTSQYNEAEATS